MELIWCLFLRLPQSPLGALPPLAAYLERHRRGTSHHHKSHPQVSLQYLYPYLHEDLTNSLMHRVHAPLRLTEPAQPLRAPAAVPAPHADATKPTDSAVTQGQQKWDRPTQAAVTPCAPQEKELIRAKRSPKLPITLSPQPWTKTSQRTKGHHQSIAQSSAPPHHQPQIQCSARVLNAPLLNVRRAAGPPKLNLSLTWTTSI